MYYLEAGEDIVFKLLSQATKTQCIVQGKNVTPYLRLDHLAKIL